MWTWVAPVTCAGHSYGTLCIGRGNYTAYTRGGACEGFCSCARSTSTATERRRQQQLSVAFLTELWDVVCRDGTGTSVESYVKIVVFSWYETLLDLLYDRLKLVALKNEYYMEEIKVLCII